eukprot:scaffold2471_cov115-Isochrysis_galbana.AAC.4
MHGRSRLGLIFFRDRPPRAHCFARWSQRSRSFRIPGSPCRRLPATTRVVEEALPRHELAQCSTHGVGPAGLNLSLGLAPPARPVARMHEWWVGERHARRAGRKRCVASGWDEAGGWEAIGAGGVHSHPPHSRKAALLQGTRRRTLPSGRRGGPARRKEQRSCLPGHPLK